jgi:hypothetical protein
MAEAGRVLKAGDVVSHSDGTFLVERVDGLRIRRVRFTPVKKTERSAIAFPLILVFLECFPNASILAF